MTTIGDYVTEEEGSIFKLAITARVRAFLRSLVSNGETRAASLMFREGPGVVMSRVPRCSGMTSPAAIFADMVRQ